MNPFVLLLTTHIFCVIVWLGTTTTSSLVAIYAHRARDRELRARLPALARWLGPRVVAPSSLGTLASGVLLASFAHLGFDQGWLVLAISVFAAATVVSLAVRLPGALWRRRAEAAGRSGEVDRADRLVLEGSLAELAILYLGAASMVIKPIHTTWWFVTGAAIVALAVLRMVFARRPSAGVTTYRPLVPAPARDLPATDQ
jgi:uncharacterized membrane protein